jgi:hypothetical protein
MRLIDSAAQTALGKRALKQRDFLWIIAKNRSTGAPVAEGYWSDLGAVSANILNPETGGTEARTFKGAGNLIEISPIVMAANLTVQTVDVVCSQIKDLNELVRDYDAKQARVEIYRGLFTANTLQQVAPAYSRFIGYVDELEIKTPAEENDGAITLSCISHTQEMSRSNPATRSDAFMRQRNPSDTFRRHAATVGTWELKWGVN